MSTDKNEQTKKPLDLQEEVILAKGNPRFYRLKKMIDSIVNRLIPEFAPKLKIEEKLIDNEINKDYAMIKHYSEIQILVGVIIILFGFGGTVSSSGIYLLVGILGVILVLTGYDIEEIYVTDIRLLVRRIGLLERIIRIPSDEEHLLKHIVSFNIGRAPTQKILMALAAIGFMTGITETLATLNGLVLVFTSLALFILGLRLGKRIVTLNLAGGHVVILGIRKGVPKHLIQSIMTSTFSE